MKKLLCSFLFAFSVALSFGQDILDKTFGNNGMALVSGLDGILSDFDSKKNIITIGYELQTSTNYYSPVIIKHDADGIADPTFGVNGIAMPAMSYSSRPHVIAMLPDDKIIIAGSYEENGPGPKVNGIFIFKCNRDGSLDGGFGVFGVYYIEMHQPVLRGIHIFPDGKILLAGSNTSNRAMLVGLTPNGIPDTQFGTNGILPLALPGFTFLLRDFKSLSDGNFLCIGQEGVSPDTKTALVKVDAQGNLVNSFGIGGKFSKDVYIGAEGLRKGKELIDRSILVYGNDTSSFLMKFDSVGKPENSFGTNGLQRIPYSMNEILEMLSGHIVIVGRKEPIGNMTHRVSRLNADGSLDIIFGKDGYFDLDVPANQSHFPVHSVFQSPGKLIITGSASVNGGATSIVRLNMDRGLHVGQNKVVQNQLTIFPNPSTGSITVNGIPSGQGALFVTDVMGKVFYENIFYHSGQTIALDLPSGFYHVMVRGGNGDILHARFVKQ